MVGEVVEGVVEEDVDGVLTTVEVFLLFAAEWAAGIWRISGGLPARSLAGPLVPGPRSLVPIRRSGS